MILMLFTYKATERARFPCSWRRVDFLRSGNFCIKYPAMKPCHNAAPITVYLDPIYTQGTVQEPSRQKLLCNADWHWRKPDVNVVTNPSCHLQYVAHCPLQLTVLSWKNSWPVNTVCELPGVQCRWQLKWPSRGAKPMSSWYKGAGVEEKTPQLSLSITLLCLRGHTLSTLGRAEECHLAQRGTGVVGQHCLCPVAKG